MGQLLLAAAQVSFAASSWLCRSGGTVASRPVPPAPPEPVDPPLPLLPPAPGPPSGVANEPPQPSASGEAKEIDASRIRYRRALKPTRQACARVPRASNTSPLTLP